MADVLSDSLDVVKITSGEGHVFIVDRQVAMVSGTIKAMLSGSFAESRGEISFPDISTPVLEKVIQYFYFKAKYDDSVVKIPQFEFDKKYAIELLMAANYLNC